MVNFSALAKIGGAACLSAATFYWLAAAASTVLAGPTGPAHAGGKSPLVRVVAKLQPSATPDPTCTVLFSTVAAKLFEVPAGYVGEFELASQGKVQGNSEEPSNGPFCVSVNDVPYACKANEAPAFFLGYAGQFGIAPITGPATISLVYPATKANSTKPCNVGLAYPLTIELSGTLYKK